MWNWLAPAGQSTQLRTASNREIYGIVADIDCLSLAFDSISFSWIERNRNGEADALAKQALWNEACVMAPINIGV